MIDFHTHFLPNVDDGKFTDEEVFEALHDFAEQGVMGVVFTPHYIIGLYENAKNDIITKIERFEKSAPIKVYCGMEVYIEALYHRSPSDFIAIGGKYLLVEFPMVMIPRDVEEIFFRVRVDGYRIVLAHPERNRELLRKLSLIQGWREKYRVLVQVNVPSLIGAYGGEVKRVGVELVKRGMVDVLGTDVHSLKEVKMFSLPKVKALLTKLCGEERTEKIMFSVPERMLRGEDVDPLPSVKGYPRPKLF